MLQIQQFTPLSSLRNWQMPARIERSVVRYQLQRALVNPACRVGLPLLGDGKLFEYHPINLPSDYYALANLKTALATGGLFTCSGLIAVNQAQDRHYYAHIHNELEPEQIDHSLAEIRLSDSNIFMILANNSWDTAESIFSVLLSRKVADRTKIFVGHTLFFGVISFGGQVYFRPS